jgi:hypothetical protein
MTSFPTAGTASKEGKARMRISAITTSRARTNRNANPIFNSRTGRRSDAADESKNVFEKSGSGSGVLDSLARAGEERPQAERRFHSN